VEFNVLTPLPGSVDHKALVDRGAWLDPDPNHYASEHPATKHPTMTAEEWLAVFREAWEQFYSFDHIRTLLRRARVCGAGMKHLVTAVYWYLGTHRLEKIHPLQAGIIRYKVGHTRRQGFRRPIPMWHAIRRWFVTLWMLLAWWWLFLRLERIRRRVCREADAAEYTDPAIAALVDGGSADPTATASP
jgi:hypothetical protein